MLRTTRTCLLGGREPASGPWQAEEATRFIDYIVAPDRTQIVASYMLPHGEEGNRADNCMGALLRIPSVAWDKEHKRSTFVP